MYVENILSKMKKKPSSLTNKRAPKCNKRWPIWTIKFINIFF